MGLLVFMVWAMALSILVLYSVLYICCVLIIFRPSKANDFLLKLMIFCLFAGVTPPITFLLQAFMVTYLSDDDTEQGRGTICFLRVPVF